MHIHHITQKPSTADKENKLGAYPHLQPSPPAVLARADEGVSVREQQEPWEIRTILTTKRRNPYACLRRPLSRWHQRYFLWRTPLPVLLWTALVQLPFPPSKATRSFFDRNNRRMYHAFVLSVLDWKACSSRHHRACMDRSRARNATTAILSWAAKVLMDVPTERAICGDIIIIVEQKRDLTWASCMIQTSLMVCLFCFFYAS